MYCEDKKKLNNLYFTKFNSNDIKNTKKIIISFKWQPYSNDHHFYENSIFETFDLYDMDFVTNSLKVRFLDMDNINIDNKFIDKLNSFIIYLESNEGMKTTSINPSDTFYKFKPEKKFLNITIIEDKNTENKNIYFPYYPYRKYLNNNTIKIKSYESLEQITLFIPNFSFISSKLFTKQKSPILKNIKSIRLILYDSDKKETYLKLVIKNLEIFFDNIDNKSGFEKLEIYGIDINIEKIKLFVEEYRDKNKLFKNKSIIVEEQKLGVSQRDIWYEFLQRNDNILLTYHGEYINIKYSKQYDSWKDIFEEFAKYIGVDINNLSFLYNGKEINSKLNFVEEGVIVEKIDKHNLSKIDKIKKNKYEKCINIIYKRNRSEEPMENKIKIFDSNFVENNKNNCIILYNNKEYKLDEYLEIENDVDELKIILKFKSKIFNLSCMFHECKSLISLPDISELDISNVYDMHSIFCGCSSLYNLDNISKWKTDNLISISYMFTNCKSLKYLPDISKWNTSNIRYMDCIFFGCKSLKSLPDISKWDLSNTIDMIQFFKGCESLLSLPDISKWNISNVMNISGMFCDCISLSYLPDISKWNTSNLKSLTCLFSNCQSLLALPDISKWDISNVIYIDGIFEDCRLLSSIPDISKWNTSNSKCIETIFWGCESLVRLPDISKWNISKVQNIDYSIFYECKSLSFLPDFSEWKFTLEDDDNDDYSEYNLLNLINSPLLPLIYNH